MKIKKVTAIRTIAHTVSFVDRFFAAVAIAFASDVQKSLSPMMLSFLRQAIAIPLILPFAFHAKQIKRLNKYFIAIFVFDALLFATYTWVMNEGTKLAGGAISGIATVSRNVFILIFAVSLKHEKLHYMKIANLVFVTAALLVVVSFGNLKVNIGICYVVIAQLMIAISTTIQQHMLTLISPFCISFWRNIIAFLFVLLFSAGEWNRFLKQNIPGHYYAEILLISISSSWCKWTFDLWASGVLTAYVVTSYTTFTPCLSVLFDYIVNQKVPDMKIWISLALSTIATAITAVYTFKMKNDLGGQMRYDKFVEQEEPLRSVDIVSGDEDQIIDKQE